MTFEEIFQEEGLYIADSFAEGVAIQIKKDIHGDNEMQIVDYKNESTITPIIINRPVYAGLFKKDYRKVLARPQLFGEKRQQLLK